MDLLVCSVGLVWFGLVWFGLFVVFSISSSSISSPSRRGWIVSQRNCRRRRRYRPAASTAKDPPPLPSLTDGRSSLPKNTRSTWLFTGFDLFFFLVRTGLISLDWPLLGFSSHWVLPGFTKDLPCFFLLVFLILFG